MEEDIRIIQTNVATYRRLRRSTGDGFPFILLEQIRFVCFKHNMTARTLFVKFLGVKNIGMALRKRLMSIQYNKYCNLIIISDEQMKSLRDQEYPSGIRTLDNFNSFNLEGRTFINPQINELIETLKLMIAEEDLKLKIYNEMKSLIEKQG